GSESSQSGTQVDALTQVGNYLDGSLTGTPTGKFRYGLLNHYLETSNPGTGTPGDVDFSPTAAPLSWGGAPAMPTGGAAETGSPVSVDAVFAHSQQAAGSLSDAMLRDPAAADLPPLSDGPSWSAAASVDGLAAL